MTDPTPTEQAAIDAMIGADYAWERTGSGTTDDHFLAMLRAVPLDYCVQRAINESEPLTDTTCSHGRPDHQVLIRQLAEALGLDLPAMSDSPAQVWHRLLGLVQERTRD